MIVLRTNDGLSKSLKEVSRWDGWLTILGGGVVLLGWCLGNDVFKRILPGLVAMNPVTALGFILAGLSLLCFWLPRNMNRVGVALGRGLAGILVAIGTLKLCQYLVGWEFSFDRILFRDQLGGAPSGVPNQIAPNTALNFVLSGLALWFLNSSHGRFSRATQNLGFALTFSSLVQLVGYLYRATYLYSVGSYPMALPTAVFFLVLANGILFAQAEFGVIALVISPTPGGVVARRLLPFAFGVPIFLGAIRMWGQSQGFYTTDFGVTMMVVASALIFSSLVWWNAVVLNRADGARREAEAGLKQAHEQLELRVQERTAELNTANMALQNQLLVVQRAQDKIIQQAELLDQARDAIMLLDIQQRIAYWNKGAELLYGWTGPEALGHSVHELLFKNAPCPPAALEQVASAGSWTGEFKQTSKTGRNILVESRWTLVKDDEGGAKSILIIDTDITEKKQYEAQVLRSQRMDSIGALAGGIAHDLNNALAPVLMCVEILKQSNDHPDRERLLEIITSSAHRGTGMVKQILSFARGSVGQRGPIDVGQLISEMAKIVQNTFPKSIVVQTNVAGTQLWKILGDMTALDQVLLNLCVNARDAMPRGGPLTLSAENVMLDRTHLPTNTSCAPGAYVKLCVTDSGTGIPPEVLARMFEPFFTTKGPEKGTGLGLSTVASIVKDQGGFIDVKTELGRGTGFRVFLPAVDAVPQEGAKRAEPVLPMGHGELILVMDDEEAVRELAKTTLESYGYRVVTACNGMEGIARFESHRNEIKLILTDTDMPFMDGLTAVRSIQQSKPGLPIIIASGTEHGSEFIRRADGTQLVNLGKPYTVENLLNAVARMLQPEAVAA
jgi:two-component system, cell cycle sensor histidine kinase and response regulator CckA